MLRIRHRLVTVVALCLVPLFALDFSVQAEDGNGTLIDGRIPGKDGDSCRVSLLASAHELDGGRYPNADDGDRPKASPQENGDDEGTESNGG